MQNIPLLDMARYTSPNPLAQICAKPEGRTTNIAAVYWYTILSVDPPRIGFSLQKTHFTGEIIKQTKEAILTIPGQALREMSWNAALQQDAILTRLKDLI